MNMYMLLCVIYILLEGKVCLANLDVNLWRGVHKLKSYFPFDNDYVLTLSCDGPAVLDAPITFNATLSYKTGVPVTGTYLFHYEDYTQDPHVNQTAPAQSPTATWTLVYDSSRHDARNYTMYVVARADFGLLYQPAVASGWIRYQITDTLLGNLETYQNGTNHTGSEFTATNHPTTFRLNFHDPANFIRTATEVLYFWWVDYVNYGPSVESVYSYNFTEPRTHVVQVVVEARFNKSDAKSGLGYVTKLGVFAVQVKAKDPIADFNYTGQTWLKHGDVLDLHITCEGTAPWVYCWEVKPGGYNVTGNETCTSKTVMNDCEFYVQRYFAISQSYTILTVLKNDVSSMVLGIPVNVYEANRKMQLSVIIVPISCTVIAIVIVIFGVAYYIQNRNRFRIEVADFDFGRIEDLEFKSFYERIRDSLANKFGRTQSEDREPLFTENAAAVQESFEDSS